MRPHVELINQADYIWHPAEFVGHEGRAYQRNMSVDEESGSASLRVDFETDWGRPEGYHHADTEWYVLSGSVQIGNETLVKDGYFHAPKGVVTPTIRVAPGTQILLYREYGDWGFDPSPTNRPGTPLDHTVTVLHTAQIEWTPVITVGPAPGLYIKMLHRDPETGFYSRLIWAKPGWTDHRLAHHPVFEEAYTLAGSMVYNYGPLTEGTYFFRPARVKHGHFISNEPEGCTWLIRSDGDLINWYTTNSRVIQTGDAENYDPDTQGPVIAGIPVRSSSVGEWDGDGR